MIWIRRLIFLYFFLLLGEGALRKWFLPMFADPLLVIRDPVVILIYLLAIRERVFPVNGFVVALPIFAILAFLSAIFFGHGNPLVALYGVRTNFLHLPLLFVMGATLRLQDLQWLGKWILLLSIPMVILMTSQFFSSQAAWVNRSIGGEEGVGFVGAMGRFRPPGTFAFITGPAAFYPLVAAFVLAGVYYRRLFPMVLVISAAAALLVSIPISISRLLALSVGLVVLAGTVAVRYRTARAVVFLRYLWVGGVAFFIAINLPAFHSGMEAFQARWERATVQGGGFEESILLRTLRGYTTPLGKIPETPLAGAGIGIGTNVGARFTTGERGFVVGEGEWGRVIGEMGPILGVAFLLYRVLLTGWLGMLSLHLLRRGQTMPFFIFSASFLLILSGQWGPPTVLGFAMFGGGLALAAYLRIGERIRDQQIAGVKS